MRELCPKIVALDEKSGDIVNYTWTVEPSLGHRLLIHGLRSLALIILSLAFLWSIPGTIGTPTLGNFVPKNFEVNAMAVDPHGDFGVGSFYAMDPTVIPWDLTKPIYKYTAVTVIVSNSNVTDLSGAVGINVPSSLASIIPFKVILIIQGLQVNAPAIVSDIESVFGMPSGSFLTLTSNPVTLPLSVFGANISPANQYPGFVNAFVRATSGKSVVIGNYSPSLLEGSPSALFFNSIESLSWPVSPIFGQSGASGVTSALFSSYFDDALGLNSTGVIVVHKNYFDFTGAASHTLDFNSFLGVSSIASSTNETFATILPNGANVTGFSPSSMLVESSDNFGGTSGSSLGMTAVLGVFPWLGTVPRSLPDITVSFYYPAFDSPVLSATEATSPSPFVVGQNFTLTLSVSNNGRLGATDLHFKLDFSGVNTWNQTVHSSNELNYNVTSLAVGSTNTIKFSFLALLPEAEFVLNAAYLDSSSFAYSWHTVFSLSANVKTNGPLTVTKTLNKSNYAYGEMGNVTVQINNPSSSTYYNVIDTTPEALPFLYMSGPGATPNFYTCPSLYILNANTTHFMFQAQNGCSSPTILAQVLVKHGAQTTFQLVAQPNIPLSQGDQWAPQIALGIPGAPIPPKDNITVMVRFQDPSGIYQQNATFCCVQPFPIGNFSPENPRSTYIYAACSPCTVAKGTPSLISGFLVNAQGQPLPSAPIGLSETYYPTSGTITSTIANLTTDLNGRFSYSWTFFGSRNLFFSTGQVNLNTEYPGSSSYNPRIYYQQLYIYVTNPITISPGGSIVLSYPYWFNVTGPLTLEPERIVYSTTENITTNAQQHITQRLVGEYVALSSNVTGVTVGSPSILPVVGTTIDATRLSFLYVALNQTDVKINLSVTNTGSQTATNVVVIASVPRNPNWYYGLGRWLPVVNPGTLTTIDSSNGFVTFSVGTLSPGQSASAWYTVLMNSTNLYETYSNVTAQGPTGTLFKFSYSGAVLAGYPAINKPSPSGSGSFFQNSLQTVITTNPSVIANGTQTTVTVHLVNEGNTTVTSISASLYGYNGPGRAQLIFPAAKSVPDMPPWTSQTVSFTVTDNTTNVLSWSTAGGSINSQVTYNQGSAVGSSSTAYSNLLVYNSKIPNLNPSVKVDISVAQSTVKTGDVVIAVVSITNTGTYNATNIQVNLQGSWPELTYGSTNMRWDLLKPGQTVKFRIGIQTRPPITYPVFVSNLNYVSELQGGPFSPQPVSGLAGSSGAYIRAIGGTGPTISTPWTSPFAPKPTDNMNVWAMMSNAPAAIGTADLDYSTNINKNPFTTIPMTSMIATYSNPGGALIGQVFAGDIYNATIPAQLNGTTVFYRIRATSILGNLTTQDNSGTWYSYTVLGFNPTQGTNSVVVTLPPGNNVLNVSQYIPSVKATITLNIPTSTSVDVKVTTLSSSGATSIGAPSPPTGQTALPIYLQIQTSIPITGLSAVIRIYYNSTTLGNLNASTIVPYHWESGTNSWAPLDNIQRNLTEMWVQGTASHFSLFALFAASPTTKPQPAQFPWPVIIGVVIAVVVVAGIGGFYTTKRRKRGPPVTDTTPTPPTAAETVSSTGSEPSPNT